MAHKPGDVGTLSFLVYFPLPIISLWVLLETGNKLGAAISVPVAFWIYYGIRIVAKNANNKGYAYKVIAVYLWPLYLYLTRVERNNCQYDVFLNDVCIGDISAKELREISVKTYFDIETFYRQFREIVSAAILSSQLLIAYSGGVLVWVFMLSMYFEKRKTLDFINSILDGSSNGLINTFPKVAVVALICTAFKLCRNLYRDKINNEIRCSFQVAATGNMFFQKKINSKI